MRVIRMLSVAAQAEGIALRRDLRNTARQAAWGALAVLFAAAAVVTAHVAVVAQLAPDLGLAAAAGIVAAGDLVIAGILVMLARHRDDPVAEEARALRATMLSAMARPDPMRRALDLMMRDGPAPLIGAVTAEAIAAWLRKR